MKPRVALIGHGAIGRALADALTDLPLAILVRPGREGVHEAATSDPACLTEAPLVVEAAGHAALAAHGPTVLEAGGALIAASVGALADDGLRAALEGAATAGGGRLILPPGAVGGVDILAALSLRGPVDVIYTGRKPPAAWAGTPAEDAARAAGPGGLAALTAPLTIFEGSAREAALAFPKNANVAATLALAGPGLDATRVRLVADPAATGNAHEWAATGDFGRVAFAVEAAAIGGNARTSATTAWSLVRAVRNEIGPRAL